MAHSRSVVKHLGQLGVTSSSSSSSSSPSDAVLTFVEQYLQSTKSSVLRWTAEASALLARSPATPTLPAATPSPLPTPRLIPPTTPASMVMQSRRKKTPSPMMTTSPSISTPQLRRTTAAAAGRRGTGGGSSASPPKTLATCGAPAKMDPGDCVEENCPWLFDGFCPCHWHDRDHHDYGFCPTLKRKAFKLVKYTDTQEGNFTQLVVGDSNYVKLFSTREAQSGDQDQTSSEIHGVAKDLGLDDTMLVDNLSAQIDGSSHPKSDHAEQAQSGGTDTVVSESADAEAVSTGEAHGQTQNDIHDDETLLGLGPIVDYLCAQESAERTPERSRRMR
ncbi:hypothetical protein K456DRAFT_1763018 [Colletotrichum gloeosporioides 23]|nr:hypothetical protein K456DRAFT_1763018 [Colletotrichum gloeosporioides 23]